MLKRLLFIGLLGLLCACNDPKPEPTQSPAVASPTPAQTTATPAASGTPEASATPAETSGWVDFEAPDQSFTVKLPKKPRIDSSETELGGETVNQHGALVQMGKVTYQLEWFEYPNEEMAQIEHSHKLEEIRDQVVGKIKGEDTVTLDGHEGVRFELGDGKETFQQAIFLVDNRVFDLMIVHEDGAAGESESDAMIGTFKFVH